MRRRPSPFRVLTPFGWRVLAILALATAILSLGAAI
jgi:hypothetical protein